ncbi:MAG: RagB/SusD family nutrient uptake outer membrane protein [Candidatus Cryptobacteroides sp.]
MKRIIYYISFLLAVVSCSGFLEEHPTTLFSKEQVYSNDESAQAAINSGYAYLSNYRLYGQKLQIVLCGSAGTMTIGNTTSQYLVDLSSLDIQTNNSAVEDVYMGSYQTINSVNDVLLNLPDAGGVSEDVKTRILGEAHFLRAVVYFNLVRMFGPLPYVDRPATSIESAHKPRTSIDKIYELIINDLNDAWEMLPDKGLQPKGRPHKYAAEAYLAKVYVALACIKEHPGEPFDASWLEDSATAYWTKAYDYAYDVWTNGGYSLVENYAELWDCYNKYTTESIFELEENKVTGSCSFMYHYLPGYWEGVPLTSSSNNYGRIRALRESWDLHHDTYPGDWRLDVTYLDSLYYRNEVATSKPGGKYYTYPYTFDNIPEGATEADLSTSEELPYIKKYVDPAFTATDANVNVIVLRLADNLLTLAEAANEIGKTSEAISYVNRLLLRARNTGTGLRSVPEDWPLTLSKEECRDRIMRERYIELKAEFTEWFDNRRRGADYFKQVMTRHNERITGMTKMSTYDYFYDLSDRNVVKNLLLPFPLAEISTNNNITESDQNLYY